MSLFALLPLILLEVGAPPARAVEATSPSEVRAEEPENAAAAAELLRLAAQQYDEGSFDNALSTLQAARSISAKPSILYNIGQVQRARHDCAGALVAYRSFLAATPANDPNHDRAVRWQADMETCVGEAASPPVGGRGKFAPVPAVETKASAPPEPVKPTLVPASLANNLPPPPAESLRATEAAPRSSTAPPNGAGRSPSLASIAGWGLLGVGAIAAGAALWYGLEAHQIESDIAKGSVPASRYVAGIEDRDRARWLGVAGGLLAAGGGAIVIFNGRAGTAGPRVALIGWSGAFEEEALRREPRKSR